MTISLPTTFSTTFSCYESKTNLNPLYANLKKYNVKIYGHFCACSQKRTIDSCSKNAGPYLAEIFYNSIINAILQNFSGYFVIALLRMHLCIISLTVRYLLIWKPIRDCEILITIINE